MKQWLYCIQQQLNSACPTEMFMIYNSILFRFMSNTIRFINKSLLHIEDIEHVLVSQYGICSRHFLLMMTCSCVCLLAGVTNWLTVKCGVAELTRHNGERKMEGDCMILMMGHMDREVKSFFKNSPCILDALKMCPLWLACKLHVSLHTRDEKYKNSLTANQGLNMWFKTEWFCMKLRAMLAAF